MQQEYARACLVSYEAEPKNAVQRGWGKPGTLRTALVLTTQQSDVTIS